jgi:thiamine kinase-like enzyme
VTYGGAYGLDLSFGGGIPADLDALFDQTKSLAATPRIITELPGGLTNRNYKVTTPDGSFVARISAGGSELLAIDRECEYRNSLTAAAAGAGAPVIEYRPQDRLLVIGYLEGRTFDAADVAAAGNLPRIAAACRRLHEGARFGNDFDMFDVQRRYLSVARARGFRIPDGYDDLEPQFTAAEKALAARAESPVFEGPVFEGPVFEGTVPCHNDLLPANLIDDGERVWLIDYELSGNNDACFELGNIAAEAHLTPEALEHLVTAYYGRPRRSKTARAWLLGGLVGMYGWTLWGAIQNGASPIAYDFWSWAMERFEGAARGFTSASFNDLLEAVQEDD